MGSSSWKKNYGRRHASAKRLSRKKKCSERRKQERLFSKNKCHLKNEDLKIESDILKKPVACEYKWGSVNEATVNNEKLKSLKLDSEQCCGAQELEKKENTENCILSEHNYSTLVCRKNGISNNVTPDNYSLKLTSECFHEVMVFQCHDKNENVQTDAEHRNNFQSIEEQYTKNTIFDNIGEKITAESDKLREFGSIEEQCSNTSIFDNLNDIISPDINKSDSVREIIELDYVFSELLNMFVDHGDIACKYKLKCMSRRRMGLKTIFSFQCDECKYQQFVHSENPNKSKTMGINKASVLGTVNVGIGHTQLVELLATMNINCMTNHTYKKNQELVLELLETVALESMRLAGEEEKRIAIESKQMHNGIPWISVVIDGSWMTRSYGTNYNSLSGLAVIVGSVTGKVLFVGIRNKYCLTCAYAERKGSEPRNHTCYKNWDSSAASTAMESDALVEGFKSSIETHGLIYKVFVSDGDSNVYKALIDNDVYRDQTLVPTRIRCYNHLQRNLCQKLVKVSKTTQPRGSQKIPNFTFLRSEIKNKILTIRKLIEESVDFRKSANEEWNLRKEELKKDIVNIPSHIFGEHKACQNRAYACNEKDKSDDKRPCNLVPFLKRTGMYQKVEEAIEYMSNYSDSLLYKLTNNIAESFNALVCVTIGGKRLNFGLTSQYNTRVYGAVLRHNTQQVITEVYKSAYDNVPDVVVQVDEKRQLKVARNREARYLHGRKRRFTCKYDSEKHYGTKCQETDINEEAMEQARKYHFLKLAENQKNRIEIERTTHDQRNSMEWISLRKQLLTASHFGEVICCQDSTSCAQRVKNILYPSVTITPEMQHGIDHEFEAIQQLQELLGENILPCGLFIDPVHNFLAGTPDGTIGKEGIVEIKCCYHAKDMTVEEALKTVKPLKSIVKEKNGIYELNKRHRYYYQVQGQLHITGRSFCIFALWTSKNMIYIRVEKDEEFWTEKMEPFLIRFYKECLLPEILDSRHNRNLPIRDPFYITKAKDEKKRKAEEKKNCTEKGIQKRVKRQQESIDTKVMKRVCIEDECTDSEEDEVKIVGEDPNYEWTLDDTLCVLTYIEDRQIIVDDVQENVIPRDSKLNDDSLDAFVRLVDMQQSSMKIQSVLFMSYPQLVEPLLTGKGVAIIGGLCTGHWRVAYYDGNIIKIYDSLIAHSNATLHEKESLYLTLRFPHAKKVEFQKMAMQQPDGTSCGIYSSAMIVDLMFGIDPSIVRYSLNVNMMRNHFMKMMVDRLLTIFPRQ